MPGIRRTRWNIKFQAEYIITPYISEQEHVDIIPLSLQTPTLKHGGGCP